MIKETGKPVSLVTGAGGFIGKNLCDKLLRMGHQVHAVDLTIPKEGERQDGIIYHQTDCRKRWELDFLPELENVNYIFHLAGVTKGITLRQFREGNLLPTLHLLRTARNRCPTLKRFLLISSQAAAGPAPRLERPIGESDIPQPIGYYGESKLAAERACLRRSHRLPVTIIRPAAVYGPGDRDFLALYKMLSSGIDLCWGNRDSYLSLIHVDDLTDGILAAALNSRAAGKIYFMTHDIPLTWRQIHRMITEGKNRRTVQLNIPRSLVEFLAIFGDGISWVSGRPLLINRQKVNLSRPRYWLCSGTEAERDLGFTPRIDPAEGLRATGDWYQAQGWLLKY